MRDVLSDDDTVFLAPPKIESPRDGVAVATLQNTFINHSNTGDVITVLRDILAPADRIVLGEEKEVIVNRLVVDLSAVKTVEGINFFAQLAALDPEIKTNKGRSNKIVLVGLQPAIEQKLKVSGLDRAFHCFDSIEEACAADLAAQHRR